VELGSDVYSKFLRALRKICGTKELLPSSHVLSDGLKWSGSDPAAFGGSADVWEGTYSDQKVAIKKLRISDTDGPLRLKKESSPMNSTSFDWLTQIFRFFTRKSLFGSRFPT
jgi:hypothetical protein